MMIASLALNSSKIAERFVPLWRDNLATTPALWEGLRIVAIYTPDELYDKVERIAQEVGDVFLVTDQRHKRVLEMWCASRFAAGYEKQFGPCTVDIEDIDEQADFDFKLRVSEGSVLKFQVAEVMGKSFQRHRLYRGKTKEQVWEINEGQARLSNDELAQRVREAVEAKKEKYVRATDLNLVLYLNVNASSAPWAVLSTAVEGLAEAFSSVWVFHDHAFCCIASGNNTAWAGQTHWHRIPPR